MTGNAFALGRLDDLVVGLKPSLLMERLCDERGKIYVPEMWQRNYIDCTKSAIMILAARQVGKSVCTAILALHVALFEPNSLVLLVSPTDRQSGLLMDKVKGFYSQLGGSLGDAIRKTEHRLRFENDSEIVSLPGTPDMIRGFSAVRLLVIDEASRTEDALWSACLPMLADDGQVVCPTTPRGRAGWFFREWHGDAAWHRIRVTAEESAQLSEAKLRARRAQMTPHEFAVEYGLSFGGSDDALFPPELIEQAMDRSVELLPVDWPRFGGRGG